METTKSPAFVILHAEDNSVARMLMARVCADESGCELIQAKTGLEAWRLLDAGIRPHLCILDIAMPELDGMSLLRRMRADRRFARMPVILCTVVQDRGTIDAAAELGVDYYLIKPYAAAALRQQIRRIRIAQVNKVDDESVAAFSTRMEVDLAVGQQILDEFAGEIHAFSVAMEGCLAELDFRAAATLISNLKVTANCLGLTSVFVELSQMERTVETLVTSPMQSPVCVDTVVLRRWQMEAGCRGCDPGLARLKEIASRWTLAPSVAVAVSTAGCSLEPATVVT